jgi:hypothetical protein
MSISSLLDITTAHDFLRGLLSLLQEFDSISEEKFDRKNQKGNSLFRGSSKGRKASGGTDLSTGIPESGDTSALFTPNIVRSLITQASNHAHSLCDESTAL